MYHTIIVDKILHYQDIMDTMLMAILDHTLKCARSVQPDYVHDARAFRVLKTAVCDVLQNYRTEYTEYAESVAKDTAGECPSVLLSVST